MNSEFFVTIPSNTKFDGNTTANFTTRLPQKIHLNGNWEVGLVEIIYPHSWKNIGGYTGKISDLGETIGHPNSFIIWLHNKFWINCLISPYYYSSLKKLIPVMEVAVGKAVEIQKDRIYAESITEVAARLKTVDDFDEQIKNLNKSITTLEVDIAEVEEEEEAMQPKVDDEATNTDEENIEELEEEAMQPQVDDDRLEKLKAELEQLRNTLQQTEKDRIIGRAKLDEWQTISKSLQDLIHTIRRDVLFQRINRRFSIVFKNAVTKLDLSAHLAYMLGFKNEGVDNLALTERINLAPYPPDLRSGFYALYVYCSLVENQIVGDRRVPLLRAVHVEGEHGEIREKIFHSPHYVPVIGSEFETIEIDIKDDTNKSVQFDFGKVVVKLHFRRRRGSVL